MNICMLILIFFIIFDFKKEEEALKIDLSFHKYLVKKK